MGRRSLRRASKRLAARSFPAYRERRDRALDAFQRLPTQILEVEQVTHKALGPRRNDHLPRFCRGLQPGGQIGAVADHRLFLRCAFANQITHDDHAGGNPDSGCQSIARRDAQSANGRDCRQTRAHRPLRCILIGAWPTEVCQNAVAHEFGDVAPETQDFARNSGSDRRA